MNWLTYEQVISLHKKLIIKTSASERVMDQ